MNKFSAEKFFAIGNALGSLHAWSAVHSLESYTEDDIRSDLEAWIKNVRDHSNSLGLRQSEKCAERLLARLESNPGAEELKISILDMSQLVHGEMEDHLFLYVPQAYAEFYRAEQLFGQGVATAFPSTEYDIVEAGKCLALGRGTASVFHCMRVLEHGLKSLATELKVPTTHKSWGQIIDQIENAIANIPRDPNKPADWKEHRQFCAEAAAQFLHFKNAWRDYTAHARVKYTLEEAEQIFRHIHDFMKHLSKRLKEPETA